MRPLRLKLYRNDKTIFVHPDLIAEMTRNTPNSTKVTLRTGGPGFVIENGVMFNMNRWADALQGKETKRGEN